ncbi:hypothetical protein Hypma_003780 [Hypsizygus marmoreus]|uniref:Uncharacterized protein n=1 Tax=Hypsizygus marmoreus TaxID=39966 RepID=A0A369K1R7_HYPMA|nr:hypothetical protein Hypma_003780 [Hypsizygus marmoreus]
MKLFALAWVGGSVSHIFGVDVLKAPDRSLYCCLGSSLLILFLLASSFESKPYEELNRIQNFVTYHTQDVYMKGATHRGPDYALVSKVYHKAIKVSQDGDFKANILYEYFPLRKTSTIPCGTTTFCRDPISSVLVLRSFFEPTKA